jgi:hypothetical protein
VLTLGLTLSAGCGGGSSPQSTADFSTQYSAASDGFKTRMAAAQNDAKTAVQSQSVASEQVVFAAMQKITADTLDKMRPLRPPAKFADDLSAVRSALKAQRDALDHVLSAAKASDASGMSAALQSYATALTTWQASAARLETSLGHDPARAGPSA